MPEIIKIGSRIILKTRHAGVLVWLSLSLGAFGQHQTDTTHGKFITDQEAKAAVVQVAKYSGLYPDFIVLQDDGIKSAIAYVKNKKRYIKYNPNFIRRIVNETDTDWSAISVLAHEIGHHLLGHTLKMEGSNPGDELAADRYSGFILYRMGATLEEAKKAMLVAGHDHGTKTHPPKAARLKAIELGWKDARGLEHHEAESLDSTTTAVEFQYELSFTGDPNTYYVGHDQVVYWFDNLAQPIQLGNLETSGNKNYS